MANSGNRPVLLLDGEELMGAKQNRVLNVTVLVPAKAVIVVPVSCVERGRWHYRSRHFVDSDWLMNSEGRARKMRRVRETLRRGSRAGDQGDVWQHVEQKSRGLGASSPTDAQSAMFERHAGRMDGELDRLHPVDGQVGAVFVRLGQIVALELLDAPAAFREIAPKLVRSHLADALDRYRLVRPYQANDVREFLATLEQLEAEWYPAVGLGREARLTGPGLTGAALADDHHVVHLSVLEDPESRQTWRKPKRRTRPVPVEPRVPAGEPASRRS